VLHSLLALGAAAAWLVPPGDTLPDDPRAVVRQARLAVEADSATAARARWSARLGPDSADRAALLGLATLARLTYDYPLAERLYRRLYGAASTRPDRIAVYARLGLSQGLDEYGRMGEVDGLLSGALRDARALGDRTAEGEALLWLAYARARSHGLDVGVALLDTALRVVPRHALGLRGALLCRRLHLQILTGRTEAAARLDDAVELARAGEPRDLAPCVRARAIAFGHRGQADSAAGAYGEYAALLDRARDRSGSARNLAWLATVLRQELAAYGEAREVLYRARVQAESSHNLYTSAVVELFLGQLFLALNDHRAAAGYMDRAVAVAQEVADSEVLMVSRSWRALVSLAAGDLSRARRETIETIDYFRRQGDLENQSEVARTLANIAMRAGDWDTAERELDRSEDLLRRLGTPAWRTEQPLERGRLALFRGDPAAAERGFSRYLAGLDTASHLRRFEAQAYLAESYARRGDVDRAERLLAAASDELDQWRATLSDQDLRIAAFQAGASAQNDRNASVARVLAALAAEGRADAAFALAERRRARELRDRMIQNAALETERSRAAEPDPGLEASAMTAADASALLPDEGTALVQYVTGALGAPTTVFLVTRGRRDGPIAKGLVLTPADSLIGLIGRFVALVAKGEDPAADGRAIGELLIRPVLDALPAGVTRLVIVPDGPLHRVPWDALRLGDAFLVERYAVGIAPSAATLAVLRRRTAKSDGGPSSLLAFGDPAFATDTGRGEVSYAALLGDRGGLPRLRGSGAEARSVARYAGEAEVRLRHEASEDYLLRAPLDRFGIVHFATHALVDDRALTGTVLALAPGGAEDGFVTPGQLAALRLSADVVVLSACRTAGGVVVDGEGVQGLTAPLLQAGARSVVATAWKVGDRSAARFIDRFYRELTAGRPVIDALRGAKLESIRSGEPPDVWAAFGVVGDPLVSVRLREPAKARAWWIAGLGLVGLVLVVTARRRSRSATGEPERPQR
jgi:hypothetical protein